MSRLFYSVGRTIRLGLTYNPSPYLNFSKFHLAAQKIELIIRFYYCFICFFFYQRPHLLTDIDIKPPTAPLWPIEMIWEPLLLGNGVFVISAILPISLAAIVWPWQFWLRLGVFLGLFVTVAYVNSFGAINHGFHFLVFIAFLLLFLPNVKWNSSGFKRTHSMQMLSVYWLIQAVILFCYSMSVTCPRFHVHQV